MNAGDKVVCTDDDWWWVTQHGAKERMSPPNPIRGNIYTITHVEPCDWMQYGDGQNFLFSLAGFERRYSHRHFRAAPDISVFRKALEEMPVQP